MILALETSSSLCAVCVLDERTGESLAEISNEIGRGHAERLMEDVAAALKLAGASLADLTAIACGAGPGSFTGIRVAVAAARGFGLALKIPVHGVTSLQSIALQAKAQAGGRPIAVVQDAGRQEFHCQRFDERAMPVGAPEALTLQMLVSKLPDAQMLVCGSASRLLIGHRCVEISQTTFASTAVAVARASLEPAMRVSARPLYLRAPDAKPQAGFAIARESR